MHGSLPFVQKVEGKHREGGESLDSPGAVLPWSRLTEQRENKPWRAAAKTKEDQFDLQVLWREAAAKVPSWAYVLSATKYKLAQLDPARAMLLHPQRHL